MSLSKRDTFVRYLDPRCIFWEDAEGGRHASIVNCLKSFGLEDTPEHREAVVEVLKRQMHQWGVGDSIVFRDHPDGPEYYTQKIGSPAEN